MKLIACALSVALGVTLLPVLLASGDAPPITTCTVGGDGLPTILATIRELESGGNYTARAKGSTASGAYQFLDSSWDGYGGYRSAWQAPPAVQDAKATEFASSILAKNGNDVGAVPVTWYIGHVPPPGSFEWDTVPFPGAGNKLTPRQYQARWLETYRRLGGSDGLTCAPLTSGEIVAEGWSLPGPRALLEATIDQLDNPHHSYPAWDWIIPTGTPIYAIRGGTVTYISTWNHNWWEAGCSTRGGGDCSTCGIGLTITDADGTRWTYCHGSALLVAIGGSVAAGQRVLVSGNTGRSGVPHLHIEINAGGRRRCPQRLVNSLSASLIPQDPRTLDTSSCQYGRATDPSVQDGIRRVRELDVVRRGPLTNSLVLLRGQVRAEVVEHDRDPHVGWVQRPQVTTKGQELGAPPFGDDHP